METNRGIDGATSYQIAEVTEFWQSTQLAVGVVTRKTMVTTSLDVQRNNIRSHRVTSAIN